MCAQLAAAQECEWRSPSITHLERWKGQGLGVEGGGKKRVSSILEGVEKGLKGEGE
jgi:hypothetical protein